MASLLRAAQPTESTSVPRKAAEPPLARDQLRLRSAERRAILAGDRGLNIVTGSVPLNAYSVYVVDDDRDVRRSLSFMLGASDIRSHPFGSGEDFLDALPDLAPGCVLLDLRMPQIDGFHVMAELARREVDWPVIVMTGHGEVPIAVRAMKLGAVDFVEKPFSEEALLACFETAFSLLDERREGGERRRDARERVAQLTAREMDVLRGLLAGEANKQLAARLGISLRTVEMHRGNMMERLGVASLAEALRLALDAGLQPVRPDEG